MKSYLQLIWHNPSMPKYPSECTGGQINNFQNTFDRPWNEIYRMKIQTENSKILIFSYPLQRLSDKIIQNPLRTVRHFNELMNYTTWSKSSQILLQPDSRCRCQIFYYNLKIPYERLELFSCYKYFIKTNRQPIKDMLAYIH
jgi:hypothetical protein